MVGKPSRIIHFDKTEFDFVPWRWPFAERWRAEIDLYFKHEQQKNPQLWNGKLLLLRNFGAAEGRIWGSFFETDYASMIAAIAWDAFDGGVLACFGAAALLSSDEAFLAGRMAPHTRNAGQICFPSGSFDEKDLHGSRVNLQSGVLRELTEETGLTADDVSIDELGYALLVEPRLPILKMARSPLSAEVLLAHINAFLARQRAPEFSEAVILQQSCPAPGDLMPWMSLFISQFAGSGYQERGSL